MNGGSSKTNLPQRKCTPKVREGESRAGVPIVLHHSCSLAYVLQICSALVLCRMFAFAFLAFLPQSMFANCVCVLLAQDDFAQDGFATMCSQLLFRNMFRMLFANICLQTVSRQTTFDVQVSWCISLTTLRRTGVRENLHVMDSMLQPQRRHGCHVPAMRGAEDLETVSLHLSLTRKCRTCSTRMRASFCRQIV